MLHLDFVRILKMRGIHKPFSHFLKLGYSRTTASKMAGNKLLSITPEKLERYCIEFNCTPNDLFEYKPNKKNPLPENHPLMSLQREEKLSTISTLLQELSIEKITELANLLNADREKQ